MASNEREIARREKKRNRDKKTRRIIWIVIAAVIVLLIVMKLCEVNFSSLKERFTDSDGKFSLSAEVGDEYFPYSLDSASNVKVSSVGNKLAVLTDTSYNVISPSDASLIFGTTHGYSNPIIRTSDSYSVIFDQGANKFRLDSPNENVYETKTDNSLLCADVANNGYIAYATTSNQKKSDVYVCNKSLAKKLSYKVQYGYVTSISINSSGSSVAFAATSSENAHIKTVVYIMNVGDTQPKKKFQIDDSVIDLKHVGSDIYTVGTDYVSVIENGKKLTNIIEIGKMNNVCYDYTPGGELVLIYNEYTNSTDNKLIYISKSGKIKTTIKIKGTVKDVSASSREVSVLLNDKVASYSLSNGNGLGTIKCNDSVSSVTRMSSKIFLRRQSLIERKEA